MTMTTPGSARPDGSAAEIGLDPTDWSEITRLGHRMVDDLVDYLKGVREMPVHRPMPEGVKRGFEQGTLPVEASSADEVYDEVRSNVLPYPHGNIHPRFFGWVVGTGTPVGMLADLVAGAINSNSGFGEHCAPHVEGQVVSWLREIFGFPEASSGILVSGCSVANLVGLAVARNTKAGGDVRKTGVADLPAGLRIYGSSETHSSNHRALELLGLGRDAFRPIAVDSEHRVRIEPLRAAIRADREAGLRPIAVIGNAGTVNVGAIDDLSELADLCESENLWLHVDGAFGSLIALSPELRPRLRGIERVDSLAFDLHKWMHIPYDAGGVLVRDAAAHEDSFRIAGAYLSKLESGLATGPTNFMDHGVQMSRGFRALKVWMTMKTYGTARLGETIAMNVRQARHLAALVDRDPELERMAPAPLNIVCFRYAPQGAELGPEALDELNRELLVRLHHSGVAAPSHTTIDGRFVLRTSITNHRTRFDDLEVLTREVVRIGRELVG